jgi:predicted metal-dependent HD superfamily phosphohydrolase
VSHALQSLRNGALEAEARTLYSDTLPYHNFDHVLATLDAAWVIIDRCRAEHIRLDAQVVYFALLFHDAGYHVDHRAHGCATKERYSIALAQPVLRRFGVPAAQIEKTSAAILATERDGSFVSAEQKAVRAADLSGLAEDYPRFLASSLKLKREHELLTRRKVSWPAWLAVSREVLEFYLGQEIRLTSYYHDETGESAFHKTARANLARLLQEPHEPA